MSRLKSWQRFAIATVGVCCLAGVAVVAWRAFLAQRSPAHATVQSVVASANSGPTQTENAGDAKGLREIWAERAEIKRLHALAEWVAAHSEADGLAALWALKGNSAGELRTLLLAKLVEENPGDPLAKLEDRLSNPAVRSGDVAIEKNRLDELEELAKTEPLKALNLALSEKWLTDDRDEAVRVIFITMANADPQSAFAAYDKLRGFDRRKIRDAIADAVAKKDPATAFLWASSQPASKASYALMANVIRAVARNDLETAVEIAIAGPLLKRDAVVGEVLKDWFQRDADESAKWLKSHTGPYTDAEWAAAIALKDSHPEVSVLLLKQPMNFQHRPRLMRELAEAYAAKDPVAAWKWLQTEPKREGYYQSEKIIRRAMEAKKPGSTAVGTGSLAP